MASASSEGVNWYKRQAIADLQLLAHGSEGRVYKTSLRPNFCKDKELSDGTKVAVKLFYDMDKERMDEIENLVLFSKKAPCNNLVRIYGPLFLNHLNIPTRKRGYIMECIEGENLKSVIKTQRYTTTNIYSWMTMAANGIKFLQENGIEYRNICSSNMILTADMATLKLAGFGIRRRYNGKVKIQTDSFFYYIAPEIFTGKGNINDPAADIYALGIIQWELWCRTQPYSEQGTIALCKQVAEGARPYLDSAILPRKLQMFIQSCWSAHPERRPQILAVTVFLKESKDEPEKAIDLPNQEDQKNLTACSAQQQQQHSHVLPADAFDANMIIENMDKLLMARETQRQEVITRNPLPNLEEREENKIGLSSHWEESTTVNIKKFVTIHRLIEHDEDGNYQLNQLDWPKYEGKMRIIGLMGPSHSGKTTLAQAIMFKLGYVISQKQALKTMMMPIGVNAYVLHGNNLIIVECCERPDHYVTSHRRTSLLELLAYSFCMKVIYTAPFDSTLAMGILTSAKNHLHALTIRTTACKILHHQHIMFVLRIRSNEKDYTAELDAVKDYLTDPQAHQRVREQFPDWNIGRDEEKMRVIHTFNKITVNTLRRFEVDSDVQQTKQIDNELQDIINAITLETGSVKTSQKSEKDHHDMDEQPGRDWKQFHTSLKLIWNNLAEYDLLKMILAKTHVEEHTNSKDHQYKLQEFFENVVNFKSKLQQNPRFKDIINEYKNHVEQIKRKVENFAVKEKGEPILLVEVVVKTAYFLIHASNNINEPKLQTEGIKIGLNGLVTLLKGGIDTIVETITLKMLLHECNIMEFLKKEEVNQYFSGCWFILTRLAMNGFRLPLLELDIWKVVDKFLKKDRFSAEGEADIYKWILIFLNNLSDTDSSGCVPDTGRDADTSITEDALLEHIVMDFGDYAVPLIRDLVTDALNNPEKAPAMQDKWLKLPTTWLEARNEIMNTKGLAEKVIPMLTKRNFEILYQLLAGRFSEEVINRSSIFKTNKLSDRYNEINKMRLRLWKTIADNSKNNRQLFCSLWDTNLIDFLIDEYIMKEPDNMDMLQAQNTLWSIIAAEQEHGNDEFVMKHIMATEKRSANVTRIHTLTELQQQAQRSELVKRWTLTRLRCLKAGVADKLISHFRGNKNSKGIEYILLALITYMVNGHTKEEKISRRIYIWPKDMNCYNELLKKCNANWINLMRS